jgi:hypothetical protein
MGMVKGRRSKRIDSREKEAEGREMETFKRKRRGIFGLELLLNCGKRHSPSQLETVCITRLLRLLSLNFIFFVLTTNVGAGFVCGLLFAFVIPGRRLSSSYKVFIYALLF